MSVKKVDVFIQETHRTLDVGEILMVDGAEIEAQKVYRQVL